jgi:hypothetical protein
MANTTVTYNGKTLVSLGEGKIAILKCKNSLMGDNITIRSGAGGGSAEDIATDEEIMEMFIEQNILMAVTDSDGAILTDEQGNIILW